MLKNRLIYLLVLFVLCLFRIAYSGYVAGMLLVIVLILPIFSWIISLPGALFTTLSLTVEDQVPRGSQASVTLRMKQSRFFSTGKATGKLRATNPVTGKTQKVRLQSLEKGFPLDTSHCCCYVCSLRRVHLLDLTGLLPLPARKPQPLTVTVLPIAEEPPEHPDWARGQLTARPFSGNSSPYDLRDYQMGDSMRAIHWKKSAALDKTVVRDTLEPQQRVASIWIDWTQDADERDLVLDQLAWCLIYLRQNNAGLYLRWLDKDNNENGFYAASGSGAENVLTQILMQPAGMRVPEAMLSQGEILLSGSAAGGAHA